MEEYQNSLQLVSKLEQTKDELNQLIEAKDSQLEELRTILLREKNKFIDVTHLAPVSCCHNLLNSIHFLRPRDYCAM